jgi:hypothetical protein
MSDILTEELVAIRRIRERRLQELMRDLDEGRLKSSQEPGTNGSRRDEAPSATPPASFSPARR